jgi:uncharacterized RDD family membrane protein YckC
MSDTWYYEDNGQQRGPVSLEKLQERVTSNQLTRDQRVWREGLADWVESQTIEGLFPAAPVLADPGNVPLSYQTPQIQYYNPAGAVVVYAGFWWRFLAYMIDYLILLVPNLIVRTALFSVAHVNVLPVARRSPFFMLQLTSAAGLAEQAVYWLYYALMESSQTQATIGKMICGLQVIDERGARIGFGRATGRYFGKILSGMILAIGYIMAGFTQRKQALHDIMAGTLVIRKNLPGA